MGYQMTPNNKNKNKNIRIMNLINIIFSLLSIVVDIDQFNKLNSKCTIFFVNYYLPLKYDTMKSAIESVT